MRKTGKLDYIEMAATGGTIDHVKAFYSAAFGWTFTDYGPDLFGLRRRPRRRLPGGRSRPSRCRFSIPKRWRRRWPLSKRPAARIVKPIFSFPGGRRFHFTDPAGNELAVWGE